jgi:hypothetical protein
MELLGLLFVFFLLWVVFKILGLIFYTGAFLITLPLKIIGAVLFVALLIPLGIFSILVGLVGILIPLAPFILMVFLGVYLLRGHARN